MTCLGDIHQPKKPSLLGATAYTQTALNDVHLLSIPPSPPF